MVALLASFVAAAAEPTVDRPKAQVELAKDVVVPSDFSDPTREEADVARRRQAGARTELIGMDHAVRGRLRAAADCVARAGGAERVEATLRLSVRGDGTTKARVTADEPAKACIEAAFESGGLLVPHHAEPTVTWTVGFDPALLPTPTWASGFAPIDPTGAAALDAEPGFNGVSWGDALSAHPELRRVRSAGGIDVYEREADGLARVWGQPPSGIAYTFRDGVFLGAVVFFTDERAAYAARVALRARYGPLRVDPERTSATYVRGAKVLVDVQPWGAGVVINIVDVSTTGPDDTLPGDPIRRRSSGGRLPKIFLDDPARN